MKTNAAMRALLDAHHGAAEIFVPSPFRLLVYGGFRDLEGCTFFRELFHDRFSEAALAIHQDRTGYECAVNKIHLEDYLQKGMAREAPALALTAQPCANLLAEWLRKKCPDDSFRIIVSVNDRICTMRFHKIRDGESWLDDDLEGYREAVFVTDTADAADDVR